MEAYTCIHSSLFRSYTRTRRRRGEILMQDILFLIVSLLLLSFITGMKMLIHIWGKKYEYKTAWSLVDQKKHLNEKRQVGYRR